MANRQIPTTLFDDSWFYGLSNDAKLLFFHIYLKSDHCGIIDLIPRRVEFDLQIKFQDAFLQIEPFLHHIEDMKYILPLVLYTQFPNGLDADHKFQGSVYKKLSSIGLDYDSLKESKAYQSLTKGLPKPYSNSNSNSQGISQSTSSSIKAKKTKKSEEAFLQEHAENGRFPRDENKMVYLTDAEYEDLIFRHGTALITEAISQISTWKSNHAKGVMASKYDKGHVKGFGLDNAIKHLEILGVDYKTAHFKEVQARKQAEKDEQQRAYMEKRMTNPELFGNE